jgi:hypothetical protein
MQDFKNPDRKDIQYIFTSAKLRWAAIPALKQLLVAACKNEN